MEDVRLDDLPPTDTPSRDHLFGAMKDGQSCRLTVGQALDLLLPADVIGALSGAEIDDIVGNGDAFLYLADGEAKLATLAGLVSSIFKTTRTIANAQFAAATFKLFNSAGTPRALTFGTTALTADRQITMPDSNIDLSQMGVKIGTAVNLNGLSQVEFAIPAGAKRGRITFETISTDGTTVPNIQLGTASAYATSGYVGAATIITTGATSANMNTGILTSGNWTAASSGTGHVEFTHMGGNKYEISGQMALNNAAAVCAFSGTVTLSDALTRARINIGANTFDAGSAVASWEF